MTYCWERGAPRHEPAPAFCCSASSCSCFWPFCYFESAFMDNHAKITGVFSPLDSEKVSWCNVNVILADSERLLSVNIENLPSKRKFRNSSYSVRKNPLVKRFRKSQSKFPKNFLFRENRQKVKCCPTPYSRRSKTFELYHFQSPRKERRFKETTSSLAGK